MRVHELPSRLAHWGVPYRLVAGWETRGNEFPSRPDGALRHWVGATGAGLRTITYGRPDLPGPLAQANQTREVDPRSGLNVVLVVASGKANHAGDGVLNGITGNYRLLGLEIDWAGPGEHFGPARKLTSELVMRAMLDCCLGDDTNDVGEHREYARPVGRKIDTNLSGDELRARMRTITPFTETLELTMSQFTELKSILDNLHSQSWITQAWLDQNGPKIAVIEREVKVTTDELFHGGVASDPPTGTLYSQRKQQFWNLLNTGPRIDRLNNRIDSAAAAAAEAKTEAVKANETAGKCLASLESIVRHLGLDVPPPK